MAQRPMKRLKGITSLAKLDWLTKSSCSLSEDQISPGALQGCRIAVQASIEESAPCHVYLATGSAVFSAPTHLTPEQSQMTGLDGTYLPTSVTGKVHFQRVESLNLPAEVQSITIVSCTSSGESILGAVDLYGQLVFQCFNCTGSSCGSAASLTDSHTNMEPGWAGISISSGGSSLIIATACQLGRTISLYQGGQLLRRMGASHQPNALSFAQEPGSPSLAVAEGHQVTLWDHRAAEKKGCTSILSPGGTYMPLYALAWDSTGTLLGTGGAESTVFVFDVRRAASPLDRWPSCLKYEVLSLHFPAQRSDYIIAGGADQEVQCNLVSTQARKAAPTALHRLNHTSRSANAASGVSFRGDSRWLGIARAPGRDLLAGFAASRNVFLAEFSFVEATQCAF